MTGRGHATFSNLLKINASRIAVWPRPAAGPAMQHFDAKLHL